MEFQNHDSFGDITHTHTYIYIYIYRHTHWHPIHIRPFQRHWRNEEFYEGHQILQTNKKKKKNCTPLIFQFTWNTLQYKSCERAWTFFCNLGVCVCVYIYIVSRGDKFYPNLLTQLWPISFGYVLTPN